MFDWAVFSGSSIAVVLRGAWVLENVLLWPNTAELPIGVFPLLPYSTGRDVATPLNDDIVASFEGGGEPSAAFPNKVADAALDENSLNGCSAWLPSSVVAVIPWRPCFAPKHCSALNPLWLAPDGIPAEAPKLKRGAVVAGQSHFAPKLSLLAFPNALCVEAAGPQLATVEAPDEKVVVNANGFPGVLRESWALPPSGGLESSECLDIP